MKHCRSLLMLFFAFALAACSGIPVQRTPTYLASSTVSATVALPPNSSSTPRPPTQTPFPSVTPTQTFTPTATLPLFYQTPTFDPASIVTVTPAPAAQCPTVDPSYKPVLPDQGETNIYGYEADEMHLLADMLNALNRGASLAELKKVLPAVSGSEGSLNLSPGDFTSQDLTGDSVPEVLFYNRGYNFAVFTCKTGKYIQAINMPSYNFHVVHQVEIEDLNGDKLPEIIIGVSNLIPISVPIKLFIFQWDGTVYQNVNFSGVVDEMYMPDMKYYEFREMLYFEIHETAQNGLKEVVAVEDVGHHAEFPLFGPWRDVINTIVWNGTGYALQPERLTAPVYRFQAVHDGDRAFLRWDFEEALRFYHQSLDDPKLKGWSEAHFEHMRNSIQAEWYGTPTPTVLPDDPEEYLVLSAYVRYKISLIYLAQGKESQALEEYEMLRQNYPKGVPGYEFAQMAKTFWDDYRNGRDLIAACANARSYADSHPEATKELLDTTWHGWQAPSDYPYDDVPTTTYMCPFE